MSLLADPLTLAVLVVAQPATWQLERRAEDRAALFAFWAELGPALGKLDAGLTFPELLNEPVFPGMPEAWRGRPALRKPFTMAEMAMALRQTVESK